MGSSSGISGGCNQHGQALSVLYLCGTCLQRQVARPAWPSIVGVLPSSNLCLQQVQHVQHGQALSVLHLCETFVFNDKLLVRHGKLWHRVLCQHEVQTVHLVRSSLTVLHMVWTLSCNIPLECHRVTCTTCLCWGDQYFYIRVNHTSILRFYICAIVLGPVDSP